jgi:ATP-dependent Clp protease ATP-binding subunit ClpA
MYERFTDRARRVMQLADQEAQRFNHEYIGTEHILLGLLKEGSSVAVAVLQNLGVDLRKIRLEVEKLVQSGPDIVTMHRLPWTPRARQVIEYSMEEARNLHHNYVDSEHILLGLLRDDEGVAAQVLMNFGLRLEEVRAEVHAILGVYPNEARIAAKAQRSALNERFTDRARKILQLANQEAQRLRHEYIGTEHILLGLAREGSGVAVAVLKNLGVKPRTITREVERLVQKGSSVNSTERFPQTPRAKKVIEYSMEEAGNLGHDYVGSEHILLGLLREDHGAAAQALINLDLRMERVRAEIQATLQRSEDEGSTAYSPQSRIRSAKDESQSPVRQLDEDTKRRVRQLADAILPLQKAMEDAVACQEFERAAKVRDKRDQYYKELGRLNVPEWNGTVKRC